MTKVVFARPALDKALRRSLPLCVIRSRPTIPSMRSFSVSSFPQLHTAVLGGRTGLQCLTKISVGNRRNP
jgi:hypothetical protein